MVGSDAEACFPRILFGRAESDDILPPGATVIAEFPGSRTIDRRRRPGWELGAGSTLAAEGQEMW